MASEIGKREWVSNSTFLLTELFLLSVEKGPEIKIKKRMMPKNLGNQIKRETFKSF